MLSNDEKLIGATTWLVEAAKEFRDQVEAVRRKHPEFLMKSEDAEMLVFPHVALCQFMNGLDLACEVLLDVAREKGGQIDAHH